MAALPAVSVGCAVLLLDQFSKWWIREIVLGEPRMIELTPFLNLVWVWNTGVSFGLLGSDSPVGPWLLSAIAAVVVAALLYWARTARELPVRLSVALIAGGAAGNIVDRVMFGAVFDFVDLHAAGYHWPAFNVADSAITVGAAVLLADALIPGLFSRRR